MPTGTFLTVAAVRPGDDAKRCRRSSFRAAAGGTILPRPPGSEERAGDQCFGGPACHLSCLLGADTADVAGGEDRFGSDDERESVAQSLEGVGIDLAASGSSAAAISSGGDRPGGECRPPRSRAMSIALRTIMRMALSWASSVLLMACLDGEHTRGRLVAGGPEHLVDAREIAVKHHLGDQDVSGGEVPVRRRLGDQRVLGHLGQRRAGAGRHEFSRGFHERLAGAQLLVDSSGLDDAARVSASWSRTCWPSWSAMSSLRSPFVRFTS